ncbi:MAG: hypothetical protein JNM00_13155 [Flavobacteriales bacterium]|nr:hypothetical protein [Flavobacteriales bacterium]
MDQQTSANPGKGLGITGFILSLVAFVGYWIVGGIATMQALASGGGGTTMIIWIVLCFLALLLSVMGFQKSSKAGAKKGLAIAGIVISAVALVLSILAYTGLSKVANDPTLQKAREEMRDALEQGMDDIQHQMEQGGDQDTTAH